MAANGTGGGGASVRQSFSLRTRTGEKTVSGSVVGDLGIHKSGSMWGLTDVTTGLSGGLFSKKNIAMEIAQKVLDSKTPRKVGTSHDDFWIAGLGRAIDQVTKERGR